MSRSGTNNTAGGMGFGGTPMARTATNGSVAMARTGTNNSSITGRTPIGMRAGRATSAGSSTSVTAAADSPAVTAAATMLLEGVPTAGASGTAGLIAAKGLTPQDGTGLGLGLTPLGEIVSGPAGSIISGLAGMTEQDQETERKRRMEVINNLLGVRWGFVSPEGLERCAKKIGFECLWEEDMGGGGKRAFNIAGDCVLIEVHFDKDAILDVGLSFPTSQESVGKWVGQGAAILKSDLLGATGEKHRAFVNLEHFVGNLQRLRRMDQLSTKDLGCFDAIDGIFKSLERVHKWERSANNDDEERKYDKTMCYRSGKPEMHVNGVVGLMLQYWKRRRFMTSGSDLPPQDRSSHTPETWSISLECDACSSDIYPSIRNTDQWVSTNVEKAPGQVVDEKHISTTNIDWLDVPVNESIKPSDARFVAHFEPPIIVPLQLALQICDSVSWPIDQSTVLPTTYETVLFAEQDAKHPLHGAARVVKHSFTHPGHDTRHSSSPESLSLTLFSQPTDYAQILTEIPFKHPMQIVNFLPNLRQWALVSTFLLKSFSPPSSSAASSDPRGKTSTNSAKKPSPEPVQIFQTLEEEFAEFLAGPASTYRQTNGSFKNLQDDASILNVNVALAISTPPSALPRFNIQFPNPKYQDRLATLAFSIGLNGAIEVIDVDDGRPPPLPNTAASGPDGEGAVATVLEQANQSMAKLREQVKKVLEISENIGTVIEWLSR